MGGINNLKNYYNIIMPAIFCSSNFHCALLVSNFNYSPPRLLWGIGLSQNGLYGIWGELSKSGRGVSRKKGGWKIFASENYKKN